MTPGASDVAAVLRAALVAAYPEVVRRRVGVHGRLAEVEEAIGAGVVWLDEALADLLARPFADQGRSPFELFQEAMRFPTEALGAAGVPEPVRDPIARSALPGDRYDLAPASSQELGEAAWRAHLAWGTAKAAAVARPEVGLLSADLMDRSRVEAEVVGAGCRMTPWTDGRSLPRAEDRVPTVAFVDLTHRDADDAIRMLSGRGVRVVAYGPHVDDFAMTRARSLGATATVPRSRFFRSIPDLVPTVS